MCPLLQHNLSQRSHGVRFPIHFVSQYLPIGSSKHDRSTPMESRLQIETDRLWQRCQQTDFLLVIGLQFEDVFNQSFEKCFPVNRLVTQHVRDIPEGITSTDLQYTKMEFWGMSRKSETR